eukprot:4936171-Pleurochrysis_carterae.AAC.1
MPRAPRRRSTALRAQTSQVCSHALTPEFEPPPSSWPYGPSRQLSGAHASCTSYQSLRTRPDSISNYMMSSNELRLQAHHEHDDLRRPCGIPG